MNQEQTLLREREELLNLIQQQTFLLNTLEEKLTNVNIQIERVKWEESGSLCEGSGKFTGKCQGQCPDGYRCNQIAINMNGVPYCECQEPPYSVWPPSGAPSGEAKFEGWGLAEYPGPKINIFIKPLNVAQKTHTVLMSPNATVGEMKTEYEKKSEIPVNYQRDFHTKTTGNPVRLDNYDDQRKLGSYNLMNEQTLYFTLRIPP